MSDVEWVYRVRLALKLGSALGDAALNLLVPLLTRAEGARGIGG